MSGKKLRDQYDQLDIAEISAKTAAVKPTRPIFPRDSDRRSYEEQARDRYLLERSLEVSSREMQALNDTAQWPAPPLAVGNPPPLHQTVRGGMGEGWDYQIIEGLCVM
jgi:hypothetical protein